MLFFIHFFSLSLEYIRPVIFDNIEYFGWNIEATRQYIREKKKKKKNILMNHQAKALNECFLNKFRDNCTLKIRCIINASWYNIFSLDCYWAPASYPGRRKKKKAKKEKENSTEFSYSSQAKWCSGYEWFFFGFEYFITRMARKENIL